MRGRSAIVAASLGGLLAAGCTPSHPTRPDSGDGPGVSPVADLSAIRGVVGQTLYVPVYSHIYTGDASRPFNLAATVSVRNVDLETPIILTSARYHDTAGRPIRNDLDTPIRLAPLATTEFFVAESDTRGGSGGAFLVEWVAERPARPPLVESVMIGTASTQGISFVCPARVVKEWSTTPP